MGNFIEYITKNMMPIVMVIIGVFAPGVLMIFIFNRSVFIEMDIWKLLILAPSICVPTLVLCIAVVVSENLTMSGRLSLAAGANAVIFYALLLIKLVLWEEMNTKQFAVGLALAWFAFSKYHPHISEEIKREVSFYSCILQVDSQHPDTISH